ncbi:MAG: putative ABC transport system permease protein [Candidatus Poriferisodalaceae bacterium]|jgi:putative ABC transport system permease protein
MRDPDISVFVFQGLVLVTGTVLVLTVNSPAWQRLIGRLGSGTNGVPIRLGLTYPLARPGRTAMLLGMYSLVIFTIMFMAVFTAVISSESEAIGDQMSSGFDIVVDSKVANPPTAAAFKEVPGVESSTALARAGITIEVDLANGDTIGRACVATGVDASYFDQSGPELDAFGPAYPNPRAVFDAMLANNDVALAGPYLLEGDGPGESRIEVDAVLTLYDDGTEERRTVTIIGVVKNDFVRNGVLVNKGVAGELFGDRTVEARHYITVTPGEDPKQVVANIDGTLLAHRSQAQSFTQVVEQDMVQQNGFIRILQGHLGLGLLIGVAGLGIVLVRAVRERQREIRMLRTMGYQASAVKRAFLVEALFIAGQGTVVGVALGMITGWQVVSNADSFGTGTAGFTIPVGLTLLILVGPILASVLAALGPAGRAAAVGPAVALRVTG